MPNRVAQWFCFMWVSCIKRTVYTEGAKERAGSTKEGERR